LAGEGKFEYVTVAVPWQNVEARKLKCAHLVMAYSALFNDVFEALNLILIIFSAFWQRHLAPLPVNI
jgi:hypothetical protein